MPTTPIQQLPRAAADAPIYLVRFVGPFTPDEIARKKKSFEVRKDVVAQMHTFLREHNALPAYSAAVNSDVVDATPDVGLAAAVQVQLVDVEQSGMNVQQRDELNVCPTCHTSGSLQRNADCNVDAAHQHLQQLPAANNMHLWRTDSQRHRPTQVAISAEAATAAAAAGVRLATEPRRCCSDRSATA
jgi:hypothetical protein